MGTAMSRSSAHMNYVGVRGALCDTRHADGTAMGSPRVEQLGG